jgi:hypothetical protein
MKTSDPTGAIDALSRDRAAMANHDINAHPVLIVGGGFGPANASAAPLSTHASN